MDAAVGANDTICTSAISATAAARRMPGLCVRGWPPDVDICLWSSTRYFAVCIGINLD